MTRKAHPLLTRLCLAGALLGMAPLAAHAQAGAPLPRCSASASQFYLMRYTELGTSAVPATPKTTLDLATVPPSGAVALSNIWDGEAAPTPSWRDGSPQAGATVAAGMGKDGYIYAMRAVGAEEPGWDLQGSTWGPPGNEWRTHTRHYEMLRYGRQGVDNLGIVEGLGPYRTVANDASTQVDGAIDLRLGPNFNAADIDPVSGIMYVAAFQTGGPLDRVFRIDVTQSPPQFLDTLTLSSNIPGAQSGDFAIDATGTWAYGVATTGNIFTGSSVSYRFRLSDGTVETLASGLGSVPFGAAARLLNDDTTLAFYGLSTRVMTIPAGTLGSNQTTAWAESADGAACLPKFVATLSCAPADLVDAEGQVASCSVTLDQPAPAGGLPVALTLPAANPRYSSTCTSPITIAAGSISAECSITATPNTVPGDGDVTTTLALAPPAADADYELGVPAEAVVTVRDDDHPAAGGGPQPIPTLGLWSLLALALGVGAFGWRRAR